MIPELKRLLPTPVKSAGKAVLGLMDPALTTLYRTGPLPPRYLRNRVGTAHPPVFIREGQNCARSIKESLAAIDRPLECFDSVLDFGCGCGRTLRHIKAKNISGCDVDAEAIAWMQRNAMGTFKANSFEPPLPFLDLSFDLIYSISVFTHLNELSQFEWLKEIKRVLRPGGIAALSVQGEHGMNRFQRGEIAISQEMLGRLRGRSLTEGFIFEPYEILDYLEGKTYGVTFHSEEYIRSAWSSCFKVVDIIPGIVDNLQDMVLLTH
jgi:SAM-dependent methyltransferase